MASQLKQPNIQTGVNAKQLVQKSTKTHQTKF